MGPTGPDRAESATTRVAVVEVRFEPFAGLTSTGGWMMTGTYTVKLDVASAPVLAPSCAWTRQKYVPGVKVTRTVTVVWPLLPGAMPAWVKRIVWNAASAARSNT